VTSGLVRCGCQPGVDELARVMHNALDQALLLQMSDGNACQASIDLQSLNENALADETPGGSFLHDTVECSFVTDIWRRRA